MKERTLYDEPARPPAEPCPRCGRIFERPFQMADGRWTPGHVQGGPTCEPGKAMAPIWDARLRKATRRGR